MGGRSIDSMEGRKYHQQKNNNVKNYCGMSYLIKLQRKKSDQKFCSSAFRKKLKGFIHQKGVRDYILIDGNVIERDDDEHLDVKVRTHGGVLSDCVWKVSFQLVWGFVIHSIDGIGILSQLLIQALPVPG